MRWWRACRGGLDGRKWGGLVGAAHGGIEAELTFIGALDGAGDDEQLVVFLLERHGDWLVGV